MQRASSGAQYHSSNRPNRTPTPQASELPTALNVISSDQTHATQPANLLPSPSLPSHPKPQLSTYPLTTPATPRPPPREFLIMQTPFNPPLLELHREVGDEEKRDEAD